jgi:hypothetical protein
MLHEIAYARRKYEANGWRLIEFVMGVRAP